jgi:hypothetical protein
VVGVTARGDDDDAADAFGADENAGDGWRLDAAG